MILFIKDVPCFRSLFVISCHVKSNWCLRPIIISLMVQSSPPHGASWWCTLCGTWSAPPGSSQTGKLIGQISYIWLWKEEISAQAHRQTVEEIIAGSRRWNRVRIFFSFWGHCLICDCRTEQPKAPNPWAALSAGLENSSNSSTTTTRAMTTRTLSKLNGNVGPHVLMDPPPSTSSYLPPVYWVNSINSAKDIPNWHMKGSNMNAIKQCEYKPTEKFIWKMRESIKYSCNVRLQS